MVEVCFYLETGFGDVIEQCKYKVHISNFFCSKLHYIS